MPSHTSRRITVGVVAAGAAVTVLSACSGSSSSGTPTATNTPAAVAVTETFPNVTAKANHLVQKTLPVMRGVASNTYQNRTLVVTFTPAATMLDRQNVENLIRQDEERVSGKATPGVVSTPAPQATTSSAATSAPTTQATGKRVKGKAAPTVTPSGQKVKRGQLPIGTFKTSPPPKS